jgi:hypothetical protein
VHCVDVALDEAGCVEADGVVLWHQEDSLVREVTCDRYCFLDDCRPVVNVLRSDEQNISERDVRWGPRS